MLNKIKELVVEAKKMGGEAFDVAEEVGLFSAYDFLELHLGKEAFAEGKLPASAMLVTEAHIQFEGTEEMDRVFLYSDRPYGDTQILESGSITDGKFVIPYNKLSELAQAGYGCIYPPAVDGRNGKSFVRYNNAFGENRKKIAFKLWDSSMKFVGNGFNQALYVSTKFENVFVMPDIHQVETAIAKMKETEALFCDFNQEYLDDLALKELVCNDIRQFMMEAGLREMGISDRTERDKLAWQQIYDDYSNYIKQLAKTGVAKIVFDNGYLYMSQDYPIERVRLLI